MSVFENLTQLALHLFAIETGQILVDTDSR
jgi:hypothetical protein